MKAAIVESYGERPRLHDDWSEPSGDGERQVLAVRAAGLNPVDLHIASGRFYAGAPPTPYVPGREGVVELPDGRPAWSDQLDQRFGSLAERTLVDPALTVPLPRGVGEAQALCFGIAGIAAWCALEQRARLRPGERVLVLGAGGLVGQIGVQAARLLGAGRVVAASRRTAALERARALGADAGVAIPAAADDWASFAAALREAQPDGFDVVLDPVWGPPARAALENLASGGRLVQVGNAAAPEQSIAAGTLRGRVADVIGYTNFALPWPVKRGAFLRMCAEHLAGNLEAPYEEVPLERIGEAWDRQRQGPAVKLVVRPRAS